MNQRAAAYDDALLMHSRMENCLEDTLYIGGVIEVDNRERGRGEEGWMRWRDGGDILLLLCSLGVPQSICSRQKNSQILFVCV